jgi:hypothetical protein
MNINFILNLQWRVSKEIRDAGKHFCQSPEGLEQEIIK